VEVPPIFNPDTNNTLAGLVLLILILAIPLTFLTSIAILSIYRRAVLRTMRARAGIGTNEPATAPLSEPRQDGAPTPHPIAVFEAAGGRTSPSMPTGLYAELLRRPWRAAAIYAIAGLCYALVTTLLFLRATKSGYQLLLFFIVFWYYAWPVAVTLSLVAASTWWTRLKIFAAYFLIIVPLGLIAVLGNSTPDWLDILGLWFLTNFPATFLLLVFLNRRIQAVGPLVLTFMILAVTGLVLLPTFVLNNGGLLEVVVTVGIAFGLGGAGIYIALLILGFVGFGLIGWLALRLVGRWYHRKHLSEQSITIDAIWLLFGIFHATGLIFEGDHWFLASLFSFVIYKAVTLAGFWLARRSMPSGQKPVELLVLRVFSLGKRSEHLFDALAKHWRYVGSIRLIAGPDLANSTMEPHEFLDFVSGKLARHFIDDAQTLDLRLSQMDGAPDYDGQFRVNDFFCYDESWRMVLSRLVRESDAVVMDLRGFSSQNAGCVFEISELVNLIPLGRVLFIIDQTTDEPYLRQVLQQAWNGMNPDSPNRLSGAGAPHLLRLNGLGGNELRKLLEALTFAVQPAPEAQVLTPSSASGLSRS
jgi:hypothetical protein